MFETNANMLETNTNIFETNTDMFDTNFEIVEIPSNWVHPECLGGDFHCQRLQSIC